MINVEKADPNGLKTIRLKRNFVDRTPITTQQRRTGAKRWIATFYDPVGKRRQVERATQEEATKAAQDLVKEACTPAAYEKISAEALLAPYGVSLLVAAHYYLTHNGVPVEKITVQQLIQEALEEKRKETGSKNVSYLNTHWRVFEKAVGSETLIASVTAPRIKKWIGAMSTSSRTRRNHLTAIVTLFRCAQASGYLSMERKTAPELVNKPKKGIPAKEIYTPEELEQMIRTVSEQDLPFIALVGLGGVRAEEIVPEFSKNRLRWEDLIWDKKNEGNPAEWNPKIFVPAEVAKHQDGRFIPIGARLASLLKPYRKAKGPIIEDRDERTYLLSKRIARVSGVPWKKNALRHSYGTYRAAITKSIDQVSMEMGNSIGMVKSHYMRPVEEETAEKWFTA